MSNDPTVVQVLAGVLAGAGVRRCFGIPGGGTSALLVALEHAGIDFVLTHAETAAALMAAADAERTGVPGVVLTSGGPGAAAVVNGVAHAHLDRVPLLVVTDRLGPAAHRDGLHQWVDHRALFAPVSKASVTLTATATRATVEHALRTATTGTPGPVHIDLPGALAGVAVADDPEVGPSAATGASAVSMSGDAVELIRTASRPLILAGLGTRELRAGTLDAAAERLQAPVLTTYKGKGAIDERSPWAAGILTGGAPERDLLERADVVVSVGLDGIELLPSMPPITVPRVALDAYPPPPGILTPPTHDVVGTLEAATAALPATAASAWQADEAAAHRDEVEDRLAATVASGAGLHPWTTAAVMSELLGADADLTVDAGAHMLPLAQAWRTRRPRGFAISNGLATMGFGLPAAIAASVADRDRHVVCGTGDGGLLMVAGELATAARVAAHLTVVVFDDRSLSLIRSKQTPTEAGRGVDFPGPDWVALAAGFGLPATAVGDVDGLRAALTAAADGDGPSLIAVATDPTPYAQMLTILRGPR